MTTIATPVFVAEFEEEKKTCCGRLNYRGASLVVGVLEIGYWFYYMILLVFACVNHREAWSIIVMSVNLVVLTLQVVIVMVGVIKRKPKLLQTHLVFLCLTLIWDLALSLGFFAMAVFPTAMDGKLINYKGREWNARVFGLVMGSLLILWFVSRFITAVIIYRYWKILRAAESRAKEIPYTRGQVHFSGNDIEYKLPASDTTI